MVYIGSPQKNWMSLNSGTNKRCPNPISPWSNWMTSPDSIYLNRISLELNITFKRFWTGNHFPLWVYPVWEKQLFRGKIDLAKEWFLKAHSFVPLIGLRH